MAIVVAGCGGGGGGEKKGGGGGGTFVFAGASDPVALDPSLVFDGESIRVTNQIFEGLVRLQRNGTKIEPSLATSWKSSPDGKKWTFTLREGVKFQDGTAFNAKAVCFNFDRWYNFPGPLQSDSASYYWNTVFAGFANPAKGNPGPKDSLYKSCEAPDAKTAIINLNNPSGSFLGALVLSSFAIASPDALKKYNADKGTVNEDTGFHPTGTFGTQHPIGTGPFKLESWTRGDRLVLARNDDYWGTKAKLEKVIIRPIADNAARLQALQTGEIQGYDLVEPQDISTIEKDKSLKLLSRDAFNVAYVAINQKLPPMDKLPVRQAIAYGLDRKSVVDNFYGGRGVVAKEFLPPALQGYADDVKTYEYNPDKAKQLLRSAGVTLPLKVDFWYPTEVSRPYMPDPKRNFEAFSASLNKSGFKVVPHSAVWSPDYLGRQSEGKAGHINLIGWTGDYADADNFIGTFFQNKSGEFGFDNPAIFNLLDRAEQDPSQSERYKLYQEANRKIMEFLPGVPYAHSKPALAFKSTVNGYVTNPTNTEIFDTVTID
jgi:peptide/nickel transport system substrate-binding protein